MPFKSEKQRRYLFKNEPAIAKKWTKSMAVNQLRKKERRKYNG